MIPALINQDALLPGDIVHSYSPGFSGRLIRRVIGSRGSHDAIVCQIGDRLVIGESLFSGGALTSIETYEEHMLEGRRFVSVLRIPNTTKKDRLAASNWFRGHAAGMPYDYWAYPRLLAKAVFGDWIPSQAGKEWAWYCTESCRAAWAIPGMSANFDVWHKNNPTPRTTEKRLEAGMLIDVSEQCLTLAGLDERLILKGPTHAA